MQPNGTQPIGIPAGTPLAGALARARDALVRADPAGLDDAYRQAVDLVASQPETRSKTDHPKLWVTLATDHVGQLLALGAVTLALRRCDEYLQAVSRVHPPNGDDRDGSANGDRSARAHTALLLLRAEIQSAAGGHCTAAADTAQVRHVLGDRLWVLPVEDHARLLRIEGLAAADGGDLDTAALRLGAARQAFITAGHHDGVRMVDQDRLMIAARLGAGEAIDEVLDSAPPQTVADHLRLASALRKELRYEDACRVLVRCIAEHEIDPALRLPVLGEIVALLRLTCRHEAADRLLPLLREAAVDAPDRLAGDELLAVVDPPNRPAEPDELAGPSTSHSAPDPSPGAVVSARFDRGIQRARNLAAQDRLDMAERALAELRPRSRTDRDAATWHLAAGELELAADEQTDGDNHLRQAVGHLGRAADLAATADLTEVRILALRRLGEACFRLGTEDQALRCWSSATRFQERVVARQASDAVRAGMLLATPDEYDELVDSAAWALQRRGPEAAAGIVVAMETARGSSILDAILPVRAAAAARELPSCSDLAGAWQWLTRLTRGLPRSQVLWIMHATQDRLHHVVAGRGLLYHRSVPVDRQLLAGAVDELRACWDPRAIDSSIEAAGQPRGNRTDDFGDCLDAVGEFVRVDQVLGAVPPNVDRIAVVAGGELSDVPLCGLPVPDSAERLGHRFALSELPCLSVRSALHRRSARQRGDRALLVSPPDSGITPAGRLASRTVLGGALATPDGVRTALADHRYRRVRIDSHGWHDHRDPAGSWLQLAPAGPAGRLTPDVLAGMDLSSCGTLVLGACESGMAHRRGRDERVGFVRAAIRAGAASVLAARWVADDSVAAAVLDRFERHSRRLPRDVALQRAQLDVCRGMPGTPPDVPLPDHPARWACWTLYGDAGWQTRAGPLRRLLRSAIDERRRDDARR